MGSDAVEGKVKGAIGIHPSILFVGSAIIAAAAGGAAE